MDERGFTLIETIIVLLILAIVTTITSKIAISINEQNEIERFFEQLQLDILTVEALSIEKNSIVYINFLSENTYRASHRLGNTLFERKLPEQLKFSKDSNLKRIDFSAGTIQKFGTIVFEHKNKNISFIVYIERGRTRIVES